MVQTYASGPHSEVNSIIWPNSEFDGDITVYGPEVKALVQRYLTQMLSELGELPDPDDPEGSGRTLLEGIELIIPHQANKTMILNLAAKAGLSAEQLYFNVERMGNVSAASIPIAVHDAVRDGDHHPADPGVRPRVRGRRRRRVRGDARRPGDRRGRGGARRPGRGPARRGCGGRGNQRRHPHRLRRVADEPSR